MRRSAARLGALWLMLLGLGGCQARSPVASGSPTASPGPVPSDRLLPSVAAFLEGQPLVWEGPVLVTAYANHTRLSRLERLERPGREAPWVTVSLGSGWRPCHRQRLRAYPSGLLGLEGDGRHFFPVEAAGPLDEFQEWARSHRKSRKLHEFSAWECLLQPGPDGHWQARSLHRGRLDPAPRLSAEEARATLERLRSYHQRTGVPPALDDPRRALPGSARPTTGWRAQLIQWSFPDKDLGLRPDRTLASLALSSLARSTDCPELLARLGPDHRFRGEKLDFEAGLALLALAGRLQAHPEWRRPFWASFEVYLDAQAAAPPGLLLPWLTMAYRRAGGRPELREAVWELNDQLVRQCQPEETPYPDQRGAFFLPHRSPQVMATAMFLAGLADAHALARASHQKERAEHYRTALERGLAYLRGAQYASDEDTYALPAEAAERVMGGLRSSPEHPRLDGGDEAMARLALEAGIRELYSSQSRTAEPPPGK